MIYVTNGFVLVNWNIKLIPKSLPLWGSPLKTSNSVLGNLLLATLLKKRLWHRCFPVNFLKFLRTPFLQNTSEWLLLKKIQINKYRSTEVWIPKFSKSKTTVFLGATNNLMILNWFLKDFLVLQNEPLVSFVLSYFNFRV